MGCSRGALLRIIRSQMACGRASLPERAWHQPLLRVALREDRENSHDAGVEHWRSRISRQSQSAGGDRAAESLDLQLPRLGAHWRSSIDGTAHGRSARTSSLQSSSDQPERGAKEGRHAFLQRSGDRVPRCKPRSSVSYGAFYVTDTCRTRPDRIVGTAGDTRVCPSRVDDPTIHRLAGAIPARHDLCAPAETRRMQRTTFSMWRAASSNRPVVVLRPDQACLRPRHYCTALTPRVTLTQAFNPRARM